MRDVVAPALERGRVADGPWRSTATDGVMGAFFIVGPVGRVLRIIASDGRDWSDTGLPGEPWEHVSVSVAERPDRTPSWPEMEWVRELFFADDEWVLQFSPPRAARINRHEGCLHLWRPRNVSIPVPPPECV